MKEFRNPFIWEDDFPPIYSQTSIPYLKRCPGYSEAKNGDMQSALKVVNLCVKPKLITEIRKKYHYAELLPVISGNKLPEALAQKIGLKIHTDIFTLEEQNRKSLPAMDRLFHEPCFCGRVASGKKYIIVDDVVTQGGTISALRKYVIRGGSSVVAAVVLASSVDSQLLAPDIVDLYNLKDRISLINNMLAEYNIAGDICELTRSQVKYLLRFNTPKKIINKLETMD